MNSHNEMLLLGEINQKCGHFMGLPSSRQRFAADLCRFGLYRAQFAHF
jgi:hypothetical protein